MCVGDKRGKLIGHAVKIASQWVKPSQSFWLGSCERVETLKAGNNHPK